MLTWIDGTLYPDTDVPDELPTLGDRVDFLARLCSAWDFGLLPDRETVEKIRRPDWLDAVEATRLVTFPAYHLGFALTGSAFVRLDQGREGEVHLERRPGVNFRKEMSSNGRSGGAGAPQSCSWGA